MVAGEPVGQQAHWVRRVARLRHDTVEVAAELGVLAVAAGDGGWRPGRLGQRCLRQFGGRREPRTAGETPAFTRARICCAGTITPRRQATALVRFLPLTTLLALRTIPGW